MYYKTLLQETATKFEPRTFHRDPKNVRKITKEVPWEQLSSSYLRADQLYRMTSPPYRLNELTTLRRITAEPESSRREVNPRFSPPRTHPCQGSTPGSHRKTIKARKLRRRRQRRELSRS